MATLQRGQQREVEIVKQKHSLKTPPKKAALVKTKLRHKL